MVNVICPFCNHKQNTKSKLKNISCSSCRNKFPNPNYIQSPVDASGSVVPPTPDSGDAIKEEKSLPFEGKKLKLD